LPCTLTAELFQLYFLIISDWCFLADGQQDKSRI